MLRDAPHPVVVVPAPPRVARRVGGRVRLESSPPRRRSAYPPRSSPKRPPRRGAERGSKYPSSASMSSYSSRTRSSILRVDARCVARRTRARPPREGRRRDASERCRSAPPAGSGGGAPRRPQHGCGRARGREHDSSARSEGSRAVPRRGAAKDGAGRRGASRCGGGGGAADVDGPWNEQLRGDVSRMSPFVMRKADVFCIALEELARPFLFVRAVRSRLRAAASR